MESESLKQSSTINESRGPKKIKIRKIRHGMVSTVSQNKNCPKFILGSCWAANRGQILKECLPGTEKYVEDYLDLVQQWVISKKRDQLTLVDLKRIFGPTDDQEEAMRRYYCRRAFFQFLKKHSLDVVMKNNRIQKTLSYLFCLQKFMSRLGNPQLMHHLQFK